MPERDGAGGTYDAANETNGRRSAGSNGKAQRARRSQLLSDRNVCGGARDLRRIRMLNVRICFNASNICE